MSLFVISKTQEFLEKGFFLFVFLLNLLSGFVVVFFCSIGLDLGIVIVVGGWFGSGLKHKHYCHP